MISTIRYCGKHKVAKPWFWKIFHQRKEIAGGECRERKEAEDAARQWMLANEPQLPQTKKGPAA